MIKAVVITCDVSGVSMLENPRNVKRVLGGKLFFELQSRISEINLLALDYKRTYNVIPVYLIRECVGNLPNATYRGTVSIF